LKIDLAGGREFLSEAHGHAVLRQINQGGLLLLDVGVFHRGVGVHGGTSALALLFPHDSPGGAQAAQGALVGDGLVEGEIDAQREQLANALLARDDHHRQGPVVEARQAGLAQQSQYFVVRFAVDDDDIKAVLRQADRCPGKFRAGLDPDMQFFENPAQYLGLIAVNTYQQGR